MKIFFVGVHNKPNMLPLDSKTRSGKLIDEIMSQFKEPGFEFIKTNLFNLEYLPKDVDVISKHTGDWFHVNNPANTDVAILLGKDVQKHFPFVDRVKIINALHPGAVLRGYCDRKEYIESICLSIITFNGVNLFNKLKAETLLTPTNQ